MAVPKGKVSKARKNSRRSANWKLSAPTVSRCPRCNHIVLAHRACANCGYYKGEQSLAVEEDK